MDEARALENNPSTDGITGGESGGYYTGSGRSEKNGSKGKTFLKKGGPIGAIIAAILGLGAASLGGQSFQAFSLVNNIMSNYGSSSYSTTARLTNMLRKAVKGTKTKLTPELEEAGDGAGLKFNTDADGNIDSITMKSTGETFDASNIDAGMNSKLGNNVSKAGQAVDVQSTYNSKTKTMAADRINWDKNRYSDYDSGKRTDTDVEFEDIAEGKTRTTDIDTSEQRRVNNDSDDISEDSSTATIKNGEVDSETNSNRTLNSEKKAISKSDPSVKDTDISTKIQDVAGKASKVVQGAATIECAYAGAATAVAAIVIAQQISSMVNMSSGYMEATQKVQAGDGDGSSFNEYQNQTNQTNSEGKGFWTSMSISSIFGGDTGNSSAGIANLENVATSNAAIAIGASVDAWKVCIGMKLVANAIDLVGDVVGLFTGGIGKVVQLAISAGVAVGAGLLAGTVITAIVNSAVEALGVDPIADMGSEEAGDYTVSGGNIILSAMGRSMGQSAGTAEKVAEFNQYKEDIIARRAEYDRDNLSPFDTSSQYTFLGSLKYSLVQFSVLNSSNSVLSFIKSSGAIISNSVAKLMPTSSAYEYNSIINQNGDCPIINSVGGDGSEALGTALHCNYVSISDPSSFEITYEEAVQYLQANGQLTYDATPKVVENTELAKYITYWTVRDSHLGLADSSIANQEHKLELNSGNNTADSIVNGVIGVVPIAGAAIDLANASFDAENYEYIFGAKYVAGGTYWNEDKELMENIQAYLELDTIYSDLALIETSTLATYLEEYYAENPLDNSYEGKLARFSGLSKDEVIAVLDYLDYAEYIANYDSTTRYKFFEEEIAKDIILDNNKDYVKTVDMSLAADRATIIYADPRALYTTSA